MRRCETVKEQDWDEDVKDRADFEESHAQHEHESERGYEVGHKNGRRGGWRDPTEVGQLEVWDWSEVAMVMGP